MHGKKAQMSPYPQQGTSPFGMAHPVLIIGIVVFVLPFFGGVIHWSIPGWIGGVGIFLILLGSVLSIIRSSR